MLLHEIARPYTTAHTAETLRKLHMDVMAYPLYSLDLVRSDYNLFCPLREGLWEPLIHLGPISEESSACVYHCSAKTFFSEGIRKLVQ